VTHPVTGALFVADSEARQIHAYSQTDQAVWAKRVFVETHSLGSSPDGCCFDDQGGLWTALVRAGQLARFDEQGQVTHLVPVPLTHPSSLCFGGTDRDELFVTSISDSGRLSAQGEFDGHVLCLKGLGFRGSVRPVCEIQPATE
jgi:sugar lactone lactonase YvrE